MDRRGVLKLIGLGGASASVGATGGTVADRLRTDGDRERLAHTRTHRGHLGMWWSVPTAERVAALTFDDGPTDDLTDEVLGVLASRGVPATFFVVGAFAARRARVVERTAAAGHELANHLWIHHSIATVGEAEIRERIALTASTIEAMTGSPTTWVRPPKGHLTGAFCSAAALEHHHVALWSITRGGPEVADEDGAAVADHLSGSLRAGSIVNLHDGVGASGGGSSAGYDHRLLRRRRTELRVLPAVLDDWLAAGYRFTTLTGLVGLAANRSTPPLP